MELPFIPRDKLLHAAIGNYAALAGALLGPFAGLSRRDGAIVSTVAAALLKDVLWDLILKRGTFDPWDIGATLVGGLPVAVVAPA